MHALLAFVGAPILSFLMGTVIVPGILDFLDSCAEPIPPSPGYTWTQAVPPRQGNWPRWTTPVVAFEGQLWAIEPSATPKRSAFTEDGVSWAYRPADAAWGERYRPAVAFFKGRLWSLGGRSGSVQNSTYHNDVWSSEDGARWQLVAADAGWSPRWDHTALVFGERLWVIGGFGHDGYANDIWFTFDGVTWTRVTEKAPWSHWKYRTFVVFRERIWAIGFHTGDDVWFSSDGAHWQQATAGTGWPATSRHKHAIVFDGRIWVLGGSDAKGDFENDVWSSGDGLRWERQTLHAPWFPRAANYSVVFRNKLWIYGGKNSPDDVWYLEKNPTGRAD